MSTSGTLGKLAHQAAKSAEQGYRDKVQKYTNLDIASGVAPLSITAWGFAQRDLEKALPFKELVTIPMRTETSKWYLKQPS